MLYDIIIIGAGQAGLTSAIYARRAAKKVLVLEAKIYGGQIINTLAIENYPAEEHISGVDFASKIYNQAKNLGALVTTTYLNCTYMIKQYFIPRKVVKSPFFYPI